MAGKATAILMDIIAKDGASAVLKKVGTELKHTGDTAEKSSGGFNKFKAAGIAMGAAVGAAVIGFGKSAVDKFKEVGGETLGLMRIMGGTAESASRLRFAAQESGVSFETLSKSTGKLEKGLGAANDGGKKTAAMIKVLGFNFRDAHGNIRPMSEVLPQLADKFKAMPGGAEKTALAMKLFGKSGTDMLPFLNKGKVGIEELMKESDKFGNTLSGKNLDAIKKSKASQREWNASLDGLKIQFGAQLLPILNSFVGTLRDKVIPFVTKVTGFMSTHKDMVGQVAKVVGTLIVGIKAWSIVQGILNAELFANPIGLVVLALVALAAGLIYAYKHSETFRKIVQAAFQVVATDARLLASAFKATVKFVVDGWKSITDFTKRAKDTITRLLSGFWNGVMTAWNTMRSWVTGRWTSFAGWINAIPGSVSRSLSRVWIGFATGWDTMRTWLSTRWSSLVGWIGGLGKGISRAASGMWNGITGAFRSAINSIIGAWNRLHFSIPGLSIAGVQVFGGANFGVPQIPYMAKGGIVSRPTLAMIGEAGPEAVVPLGRGIGGGDTYNITVNGALDAVGTGRAVVQAIKAYKLSTGGRALGIA